MAIGVLFVIRSAKEDPMLQNKLQGYVENTQRVGIGSCRGCGEGGKSPAAVAPRLVIADEPSVLDYNTEFKTQDLYTPTPCRSSNHDPVVVGLQLRAHTLFLPVVLQDAPTGGAAGQR